MGLPSTTDVNLTYPAGPCPQGPAGGVCGQAGEPVQLAFDPDFDAMIERAEGFDIAGVRVVVVTKDDLIAMKRRAAADPARRKSKRLRDQADVELLLGDVPHPDEGW